MKIVCLTGGLGNQMFQYAFGQVMEEDVAYDASWFDQIRGRSDVTQRSYELDFFKCTPWLLSLDETVMIREYGEQLGGEFAYKIVEESPENIYAPDLLKLDNVFFSGYFQCHQYPDQIREQLLADFVPATAINPANQKILEVIQNTNSVSLHVRRGDYVHLQHIHGLCQIDYYQKAIEFIASKIPSCHFFLFSDDILWVKENLKIDFPFTVVDFNKGKESAWDMWLMKHCKHNIIANSTFSWWGAWLNENPNKIVIAPKKWWVDGTPIDIVPPDWVNF